jgi:uncharacterized protein
VSSTKPRYLLDLNSLIALGDPDHQHHQAMQKWFQSSGKANWGVCSLTEAGFIRVTTNPVYRPSSRTVEQATAILADFATAPGYRYWPIVETWATLTAPFSARLLDHQPNDDAARDAMVLIESYTDAYNGPRWCRWKTMRSRKAHCEQGFDHVLLHALAPVGTDKSA